MEETLTSSTLVPTTFVPGLQNDFSSSGLSDHSKNIVIGVVVGIGGAAILALIAVIIWRHMRKEDEEKRNTANLSYFSDDPATQPAGSPGSNKEGDFRSPNVNAASNF
jgi:Mid2 like cell wall stress sensor